MLLVSGYRVSRASSRCPLAVRTCCHVPFARVVSRAVLRASSRVNYACRASEARASPRVIHTLSRVYPRVARASFGRVVHVCRAASTRNNKLFSLININVSNVNS